MTYMTALEGLHVTGKYWDRSMQQVSCSRHAAWGPQKDGARLGAAQTNLFHRMYLLIGFRKSTLPQNRQIVVNYYQYSKQVDGFVLELIFVKRL